MELAYLAHAPAPVSDLIDSLRSELASLSSELAELRSEIRDLTTPRLRVAEQPAQYDSCTTPKKRTRRT